MSTKRPLILFSGGLDSTFACFLQTKENQRFDVLYVNGGQGRLKTDIELHHRRLILDWLRKFNQQRKGDDSASYAQERSIRSEVVFADSPKGGFLQAVPWMIGALEAADPDLHSEVQIAYVAGDQILSCLPDLEEAWNALWRVSKRDGFVPLKFPLRFISKAKIIEAMPRELYDLTWVCELPDGNPVSGYNACGRCLPCETRAVEEYRRFRDTVHGSDKKLLDTFIRNHPSGKDGLNVQGLIRGATSSSIEVTTHDDSGTSRDPVLKELYDGSLDIPSPTQEPIDDELIAETVELSFNPDKYAGALISEL